MSGLINEFSWSKSRANVFSECPRRYWFQYYGAWGGWDGSASPAAREAYQLKQLTNRWAWIGATVHVAVERIITSIRLGAMLDEAAAQKWLIERLREQFKESLSKKYKVYPKSSLGLVEHEYGPDPGAHVWKELTDKAARCLTEFYSSPYAHTLPNLPRDCWLPIEELESFQIARDDDGTDAVRVFVKLDLAYRREVKPGLRGVEIVDWKTGKDNAPDPIQLACYALYAHAKGWVVSPEQVITCEYNLATGHARESYVTHGMLEAARKTILDSADVMRVNLAPGNVAAKEDFKPTPTKYACRGCNFQRICPERAT